MIKWKQITGVIEKAVVKEEPGKTPKIEKDDVETITLANKGELVAYFRTFLDHFEKVEEPVKIRIHLKAERSIECNKKYIHQAGFTF